MRVFTNGSHPRPESPKPEATKESLPKEQQPVINDDDSK